jgi:hypothetical protein
MLGEAFEYTDLPRAIIERCMGLLFKNFPRVRLKQKKMNQMDFQSINPPEI